MSQDRSNGLALLRAHRQIDIYLIIDQIIERSAKMNTRTLDFFNLAKLRPK